MISILFSLFLFILSVAVIMIGSDWITDSSIHLARRLGTSNLAFGLVIISVLLSLPEVIIAVSAILKGHPSLGFGSAIGSVIVNIGLIVGVSALIRPLKVPRIMVTRDMIYMTVVSIVVVAMALEDRFLSRTEGFVFFILFIPYVINVYEQERNLTQQEKEQKAEKMAETLERYGDIRAHHMPQYGLPHFVGGFILLLIGAEIFIRVLLDLTLSLGMPELLIGITLGALGPSIPNLAAALGAARKGVEELVISETIGANIFTLLITIGIIAMLSPLPIDEVTALITAPSLLAITFILLFAMLNGKVTRTHAILLLLVYVGTIMAEFMFRQSGIPNLIGL